MIQFIKPHPVFYKDYKNEDPFKDIIGIKIYVRTSGCPPDEKMSNQELKEAFLEIEELKNTGFLKQNGVFNSIHSKYEEQMESEKPRRVTEKAILIEIGKRFVSMV